MTTGTDSTDVAARYVFRATVALDPAAGWRADPDRVETVLSRTAPPPDEDG